MYFDPAEVDELYTLKFIQVGLTCFIKVGICFKKKLVLYLQDCHSSPNNTVINRIGTSGGA